jgi:hypothetical protein
MSDMTRNRRFLAIGALIYAFVSVVWMSIAYATGGVRNSILPFSSGVLILLLVSVAVLILAGAKDIPVTQDNSARLGQAFGTIFAVQGIVIGVGSGILAGLGLVQWIVPLVAVTVGLHFIPLAHLLKLPLDYVLGVAILALVTVAVFTTPAERWPQVISLGTATLLWLAGCGRLWVAIQFGQRTQE